MHAWIQPAGSNGRESVIEGAGGGRKEGRKVKVGARGRTAASCFKLGEGALVGAACAALRTWSYRRRPSRRFRKRSTLRRQRGREAERQECFRAQQRVRVWGL